MTETKGYFGQFGGSFVPEPIQNLLNQLEETFEQYKNDPEFIAEYKHYLKDYSGRETPLYFAESLTDHLGGAKIYLKREDLNHLGSHKLNNVLGQILLAKRMGKTRVIAETGAGQHGVATAAAAAKFGMACDVYMGAEDVERQRLNVFRMEMMGATVHAVETGTKTLKDAVDAAFGAWMADLDAFYVLGSAVGPHPYPTIVHEFQKVISEESKRQILEKEGRLPDYVIACVGGGSNAIGAFSEYVAEEEVGLIGVEAAGHGLDTDQHAATMTKGTIGVVDGMKTYAVFGEDGKVAPVYSISAGLDYPGVGPEHAFFKDSGRVEYVAATDDEAVEALLLLSKTEGILPAIESSHAIAEAVKRAPQLDKDKIIIINVSGRGDKDVAAIADYLVAKAAK
ncbi:MULTISPECIES: tryptophan synthase subunit beta [Streptococcus]|mgnify:FL=1|jgi:tryptophan synthase beta chain|uniref:Tryptophan synthase beta chain n=1 Tax=Streptococcus parasanguinis TaxID=1318 RepID=A0A6L6LE66_STRPA|nr:MULTISPECIES: tryptophan synthase subunit beta [Streptococcus]MTR63425.1 tryptophan synthase subunit beta [Streptococcus parasanguinis]MTR65364.1 tryptophan synthase subunit beta [Streptococcus parasanguinis]MTR68298.1 tryptophan synthase subunit beta [Streptococcus parasanguinis]MTS05294.1 tryptophan synthase subunit beta [Streptococcus parasanguinis]OFQ82320.1 tryptophan synthase subunit beta [Streptococcus sp. HMSC065C01]